MAFKLDLIDYTKEFKDAMRNWDTPEDEDIGKINAAETEIRSRLSHSDKVVAYSIGRHNLGYGKGYHLFCNFGISMDTSILWFFEIRSNLLYVVGKEYTSIHWAITSQTELRSKALEGQGLKGVTLRKTESTPLELEELFNKESKKSFW